MQTRKFTRKKEDFKCQKCGLVIKGTGYTNHCPNCLWSKHVDINPGDRRETCKGMMEPLAVINTQSGLKVLHKCTICGHTSKNKLSENDDKALIADLSTNPAII
jgi:rubrerythrin